MLAETVALVSHVVPEQIIAEGQAGEEHVAQHVPSLEAHRFAFYALQDGQHSLRGGKIRGGKSAHVEVELLIEEFEQGAVQPEVVRVDVQRIHGRGYALAAYRDGVEEEGSVFVLALLLLLPFEEARRQIQREGARFLLDGLFLAEEAQEGALVVFRFEHGAQPAVAVFVEYVVRKRLQKTSAVESVGELVKAFEALFRLAFEGVGADLRHVLHKVLYAGHEQFDDGLRHLEIEQRVAHVHVQQTPLPLRDAADLLFAADVAAVFLELFGRKVGVVVLALPQVVPVLALHPFGEREDVHDARAFDVYDEFRVRALFQHRLRALFRLFEGHAAEHVARAHKTDVAHAALRLLAQHIHVVAYQIGQTFVDEETPGIPLAVDERNERVLSVGLHHCGEHERRLQGRRRARHQSVAVIRYESAPGDGFVLGAREFLIGEDAVACRKMVAHVVARA